MDRVVVRYSEIGSKSGHARNKMIQILRQRVEDRIEHEGLEFDSVRRERGRVIVETSRARETAENIAELPGVASTSPAVETGADLEDLKNAAERFDYGPSFAVDANRAGEHGFTSQDVERELGSHIEELTGSKVDLESPDTTLGVDVRFDSAYLFKERFDGPGGLPVGSQEKLLALISGGIDSPVAAWRMMKRGSDIIPVYFYNRPIAAEDHLMRLKASLRKLERFNPSREWSYYLVEMEEVNRELMEIDRGRMLLLRAVMFGVAEELAGKEGAKGIVTGESLGQKSSQTASNLDLTSREVEMPVHRPLVGENKHDITAAAREIGTYREARIDSACRNMAPDNPSTSMKPGEFMKLRHELDLREQVERALEKTEKHVL